MKKLILVLGIVPIIWLCARDTQQDMLKVCLLSTVLVTDGMGSGSGVAIEPNLILTAGHCVEHDGLYIVDYFGKQYEVIDQWKSPINDVGFVRIDGELPTLLLGNEPELFDNVVLFGSPLGQMYMGTVSKGFITCIDRDIFVWTDIYQATIFSAPGSSGGPLLNDRLEIVGICVGGEPGFGELTLCETITHIREDLERFKCQKLLKNN